MISSTRELTERVVLVDEADREIGVDEKLAAHRSGALHRALSVFIFDSRGRALLQRRAEGKYHSAGLWSNACCSHPRPGEPVAEAAARRLREEMGISCPLRFAFTFIYRAEFENGLIEHELDHVFIGVHDGDPAPDPAEAQAWRWAEPEEVMRELREDPENYSVWFRLAFERVNQNHRGAAIAETPQKG